jgi:zinc protease
MIHRKEQRIGRNIFFIIFLGFLVLPGILSAQEAALKPDEKALPPLTEKIPTDPLVTTGVLENGLSYYIRHNTHPEKRAELRLAVNAGSMQEEDDQRGLAHFIEHMAFNGTAHFAEQEIIDFMESIGMRFGPSVNAYTGFDETVYMLQIPTDSEKTIRTAFQILEDWAHNISFEAEEIEKERGVIIEEWRLGQGAESRLQEKQFPVLFKGSRYALRLPIGGKDIIESFPHERLKDFYRDWYRPDLMAVVAVGDFDKDSIEELIKSHFSGLENPSDPKPRVLYPVPDHEGTLYSAIADPEVTRTSVSIYHKLPLEERFTYGDYRREIVEMLFTGMLSQRYAELSLKPDPPFLGAAAMMGALIRSKAMFMMAAGVEEGKILEGLEALCREVERVSRFGFTEAELERQRVDMLRSMESVFEDRNKQNSRLFAEEYLRNFLEGEPIPGIALEYRMQQQFLPGILLEEINRLAGEWTTQDNRVVLITAPEKEGLDLPDEEKVAAVLEGRGGEDLTAYTEESLEQPLLADLPEAGEIVESRTMADLGITEWTLSNGAKVVLKPTDFKKDEVVFRAFSPGGTSLASDEDFIPASTAAQIIVSGGLGEFSALDLRKKLAGKAAFASAYISELEEGLRGSGSPKDLETLFQLIYLTFTAPRADETIFQVTKTRMKAMIENRAQSPELVYMEALQKIMGGNHPRRQPMTVETLAYFDLQKSLAFYRDRFADAGDFTFLFVGAIDPEVLKPLAMRYLASLPSLNREETWRDVGAEYPRGVIKKVVRKGLEPKSLVSIAFTGPFAYNAENRFAIRAVCEILQTRLRKILREDLSGTYGAGVRPSYRKYPDQEYSIAISFGTDPERVEELTQTVFAEIEKLKAEGPEADELKDVKEAELRDFETNIKNNGWLAVQLALVLSQGEDLRDLTQFAEVVNQTDPDAVREAAKIFFDTDNYVQVTLLPEEKDGKQRSDSPIL